VNTPPSPRPTRATPPPLPALPETRPPGDDGAVAPEALLPLGFDAAKARAVFNCLSKLGRAAPRRAGAGGSGGLAYCIV
jgi:hypothetical protein